jgi:hypothetical protein
VPTDVTRGVLQNCAKRSKGRPYSSNIAVNLGVRNPDWLSILIDSCYSLLFSAIARHWKCLRAFAIFSPCAKSEPPPGVVPQQQEQRGIIQGAIASLPCVNCHAFFAAGRIYEILRLAPAGNAAW